MSDQICLPYELLRLRGSPIEGFFFIWVFPWLFLLGMIGNSLNLMVLLSPRRPLRRLVIASLSYGPQTYERIINRADSLLLALAFCDMLFLLLLLPSAMAQFDRFSQHPQFRWIYLTLRVHLIGFANWCSAVAIWLIIAICADRLLGIRSLRRVPAGGSNGGTGTLMLGIIFVTGLLTSYNHFSYHCVLKWLCNGGQVVGKCFDVLHESWPGNHTNQTPQHLREYVRWSLAANALLVVLLPVLLMFFLNAALLLVVRRHSFPKSKTLSTAKYVAPNPPPQNAAFRPTTTFASSSLRLINQQADHRVTVSVAAIVSAFTLTQGPSALVLLARLALADGEEWPGWPILSSVTGFLVVLGKSLNCVLLCLSSASFRRRLALTLQGKRREFGRKRGSSVAGSLLNHPAGGAGFGNGVGTTALMDAARRRWSRGRGRSHSLP